MTKLEFLKQSWRPAFLWAFIGFFVATGATVLFLLWFGKETLTTASGILMAMLGMGGAVAGVYTAGRSYEKGKGVSIVPATDPTKQNEEEVLLD